MVVGALALWLLVMLCAIVVVATRWVMEWAVRSVREGCRVKRLKEDLDELEVVVVEELKLAEAESASPVARALVVMMEERSKWEGTPSELLEVLNVTAERTRLRTEDEAWPKSAGWVWRRILEVQTDLRDRGVLVERDGGTGRTVRICRAESTDVSGDTGLEGVRFGIGSERLPGLGGGVLEREVP
jgi:hypothetical protein